MTTSAAEAGPCGRRVRLERFRRRYVPAVHAIVTAPGVLDGWPLRGLALDQPQLEAHLWRQSQLQYVVIRRDTDEVVGLAQAVQPDRRSGVADVAITLAPGLWQAGWPLEGFVLLANHMFDGLGYRKLYLSMPETVRARVGRGVEGLCQLECTLTDHVRYGDDGYEDVAIFALHRDGRDTPRWRLLSGWR